MTNNKMMIKRKRREVASMNTAIIMLFKFVLITCLLSSTTIPPLLSINAEEHQSTTIDLTNNGHSNLLEGQRLFQLGQYQEATTFLWRAVLLHSSSSSAYTVNEAFTPFLQCYIHLDRLVDGMIFISAESYLRGQDDMGEMYLRQALERHDDNGRQNSAAVRLKEIVSKEQQKKDDDSGLDRLMKLKLIQEVRDSVDLALVSTTDVGTEMTNSSISMQQNGGSTANATLKYDNTNDISNQYKTENDNSINLLLLDQTYQNYTPEQLYNMGTQYFNTHNKHNLHHAEQFFQLSCIKSNTTLAVACTTAVYLRSNLCIWGVNGTGFERDMEVVRRVTRAERERYRSVRQLRRRTNNNGTDDDDIEAMIIRKKMGISNLKAENDYILWNRATSVHPHMMLGYPLSNDDAILKRYSAESLASLDELRARAERRALDPQQNGGGASRSIPELPADLPYSVMEMRDKFVKKNEMYKSMNKLSLLESQSSPFAPIKVGFVACGFNSKAVLYLSHDIFRFFDPDIVEIHIFSTGQPDPPHFIEGTMRGVDWRQRVMDTVDYFHDVREYKGDHIGLARYIHDLEIQILIEWDGYARQGDRAGGLMALRPAPIQILHQEFLMTSGAQYIDYIVTDKTVSPLELEGLYTEKFLWLPNHFFMKGHAMQKELHPPRVEYVPKAEKGSKFELGVGSPQENACLSSNPLGRDSNDDEVSFVYCNFNKFLKHNPETMRSWTRILEQVPNSILCLLENPVEGIPNLRKFVTESSSSGDNLNDRIHSLPWEKNPFDHQRRSYSLCNAMLDSYPYNGHTTAQDALYAGVPIVTRSDGNEMSSRVSTSANVVLGLEAMNAYGGVDEYETIAIRLGTDKDWFESIRTKLIDTCLKKNPMHPYWDVPRYVNNFQNGLKAIWNNFLTGNEIEHVEVEEERKHGTMETEIVAREEKRKKAKDERKRIMTSNDEL